MKRVKLLTFALIALAVLVLLSGCTVTYSQAKSCTTTETVTVFDQLTGVPISTVDAGVGLLYTQESPGFYLVTTPSLVTGWIFKGGCK